MKDWKKSIYHGFTWNFLNEAVNKLLSFGFGMVLARLLYPKDFGLVAMATIFLGFAEIFKDFGITTAIIQKINITKNELSSAFWFNLITGSIMALLVLIGAKWLAFFYREPDLIFVIYVLAINFFLSSLSLVHFALLIKSLDFKKLFLISVISEIISAGLAIYFAMYGWGFWSILIKILSRTCLQLVLLWGFSNWKPQFWFSKKEIQPLIRFSLPLVGTQSMNYWVRKIDDLLVGKLLGNQALGIYDRSYAFLTLPLGQIKGVIGKVALPFFSIIQSDPIQVRWYFLKMTRIVGLISFPFMLGLYFVADDLVFVLLGEYWMPTVGPLKIFALTGIFQSVIVLIGVLFISQGKTKLQFRLGVFTSFVGIVSLVIGLNWGLEGVAWGLFVATIINLGPNIYFAGSIVGINILEWFSNLKEVALSSLLLFLWLYLIQNLFIIELGVCRLFLFFFAGILIYYLTITFFKIKAFDELKIAIMKFVIK
ncbi:MAG: lipopolysaccharide biosynthesis protein [Saprospiraceae bacterium]